jgi:hypothetical protein
MKTLLIKILLVFSVICVSAQTMEWQYHSPGAGPYGFERALVMEGFINQHATRIVQLQFVPYHRS